MEICTEQNKFYIDQEAPKPPIDDDHWDQERIIAFDAGVLA
jgi:hypothetical protein